jgi:hypothetical protein
MLRYPYYIKYAVRLYVVAGLFAAGLIIALLRRVSGVIFAEFILAIASGMLLATAVFQVHLDYSITYDYGQEGFSDTAAYVYQNTGPNDIIASMKDIGFKAHRPYFETYGPIHGEESTRLTMQRLIDEGQIKLLVFTEDRGQDQLKLNPQLQKWILSRCKLIRSFGNYRIYAPPPPVTVAAR